MRGFPGIVVGSGNVAAPSEGVRDVVALPLATITAALDTKVQRYLHGMLPPRA
ncbi:hypothetical protein IU459_27690 [Nocardia amamiensis]|uniref:Uncharacterized protein n=1 Tax=Nocardia amamiensis TaxID=404578 RepID=A0ABS0CYR8_9NOCA|nr:hypothetical protein [Nocardia amamiensis]MBF6301295.1 hypothetical protein [Nocardia amamiensis]